MDRRVLALCLVLIAAGCTSSGEPASAPAPSAAPPVTPSVTPPVTPSVGSLPYSAARVSIKPPQDGSFLVRGAYPKSQSNCKRTHRATIEARYPGTVSVRSADDGTMSIVLTLPFERYLEGIAEVPPSWPRAALEAQAIAARSYALASTGWEGAQFRRQYTLQACDWASGRPRQTSPTPPSRVEPGRHKPNPTARRCARAARKSRPAIG